MALPFYLICALNVLLLVSLAVLSRSPRFGCYAGSAVNPLQVFVLIGVLFNLDFLHVWDYPIIDYLEYPGDLTPDALVDCYGAYTALFVVTVLGVIAALGCSPGQPRWQPPGADDQIASLAAKILFFTIIGCTAPLLMWFRLNPELEGLSYQAVIRDNPLISVAVFMISPVTSLFIANQARLFSKINCLAIGVVITLMSTGGGSRAAVLLILLIVGCAYATRRRISSIWYVPIIPLAALFMAFSRYTFREGDRFASFSEFLDVNGGLLNLYFDGEEISFAKMFSSLHELAPVLPQAPYPFQNVVALLVSPIPRSILAWKPLGGSAMFTQQVSPYRWEWTKSEMLISGFGDMYWQFGLIGALLAMFALGFFWMWCCMKALNQSRQSAMFWTPLLTWWMYVFMRGDLFNVSLLLWPAMMVFGAHNGMKYILQRWQRYMREQNALAVT